MYREKFDYLVFGANGQDGFFMTRYLLKKKFKVIAVARKNFLILNKLNLNHKKSLKILNLKEYNKKNYFEIFKNLKVKKIFFFAGFSKIPENEIEKKKCLEGNFKIIRSFLEFIDQYKSSLKVLYISSSEIYGSKQKKKRNENSLIKPENFYGECKSRTQKLIIKLRKEKSLFISSAIAYNHESILTPQNHLIPNLVGKFVNCKDKIIKIFNPNEFRNISHVYDFLPIFKKILDLEKPNDFIMANDINYKIIDIVKIINKNFYSNKFKIKVQRNKKISISRKADNKKIKKLFNYEPRYDIYKILKRFFSYKKKYA